MRFVLFLIAAAAAASSMASAATVVPSPIISTPQGPVFGQYQLHNTYINYNGIPYAQPPVGSLRWRNAEYPANSWSTPLNGTVTPATCVQGMTTDSEDCLYLQVWAPAGANSSSKLPVVFSIPGGAFLTNSAWGGSGVMAVSNNFIWVVPQYRVNVFGFLSTLGLSSENSPVQGSGSFGLSDQQAGLRWVQDNIAAYGGDPTKVTLFGQSAGSWSVCLHQVMPGSAGLFYQAMSDSGGCDNNIITHTLEESEAVGQLTAASAGCALDLATLNYTAQVECLRSLNSSQIYNSYLASGTNGWYSGSDVRPTVDGTIITDRPAFLFATGQMNKVPLLTGSNADEGNALAFYDPSLNGSASLGTLTSYIVQCTAEQGVNTTAAAAALAYYTNPSTVFPVRVLGSGVSTGYAAATISWLSGQLFQCGVARTAGYQTQQGHNAFLYDFEFSYNETADGYSYGTVAGSVQEYAFHSVEGNYAINGPTTFTSSIQKQISGAMQQYWLSFALNGNPNNATGLNLTYGVASLPQWPVYSSYSRSYIQLGDHQYINNGTITPHSSGYHVPDCLYQDALLVPSHIPPRCATGYSLSVDTTTCRAVDTATVATATEQAPAPVAEGVSTGASSARTASSTLRRLFN